MALTPTAYTIAYPRTKPLTETQISKFARPFLAYQSESSKLPTDITTPKRNVEEKICTIQPEPPPYLLQLKRKKHIQFELFE